LNRLKLLFLSAFAITVIGMCATAWAWGDQGHEIIAIIAADNLSPSARDHVAKILGTTSDTNSLEKAMAAASIRPDTEFRPRDRSTAPWHFIDICLQDQKSDLPSRCPGGTCVTAKIDEYANRMKAGDYDQWGASGDLAFLIHLVGDLHQPLHAATDADRGGNCIAVESHPYARNLHAAFILLSSDSEFDKFCSAFQLRYAICFHLTQIELGDNGTAMYRRDAQSRDRNFRRRFQQYGRNDQRKSGRT
jgi:hypothetical protein